MLFLIAAIFTASRALVRALPGDPLETLMAESGTSLPLEVVRHELHLDQPFFVALAHDATGFMKGDLGVSLLSKKPVAPVLLRRIGMTAALAALSAAIALALSLALGLPAAMRPGGAFDRACSLHGALTAALPMPWIGPVLLVVFAVWIPLFPVGGGVILPALALALAISGLWARLVRERVAETLGQGPAQAARARGLPEWRIALKYGLMPASGALVAYLGTQLGGLMAGAFVVESIFDWKGLGALMVEGVLRRDYPVVESAIFVSASATLIGTYLGDWAQRFIDPRIRDEDRG